MRKIALLSIFLMLTSIVPLHADMKKLGQAGFKFLDVEIGARAAGMGEAFTVVGSGVEAIFYNPAGIAQVDAGKFEATFSRTNWIAESSIDALGLTYSFGTLGKLGISLISTDYGIIQGTRFDPEAEQGFVDIGELDVGAYAAGISYARRLTDKFMIGGNVKYAHEKLGSSLFAETPERDSTWTEKEEVSTLTYDMGTIFYPGFKSFRMGMVIRNFSTEVKYEVDGFQLPLTFHVAFAMDVLDLLGEHPDRSLLVDFEVVHPRDYSRRYHLGGELSTGTLKLRTGYKFGYDEEGLCFGVGLHEGNIKVDYAYSEFGVFDFVNRISLGVSF